MYKQLGALGSKIVSITIQQIGGPDYFSGDLKEYRENVCQDPSCWAILDQQDYAPIFSIFINKSKQFNRLAKLMCQVSTEFQKKYKQFFSQDPTIKKLLGLTVLEVVGLVSAQEIDFKLESDYHCDTCSNKFNDDLKPEYRKIFQNYFQLEDGKYLKLERHQHFLQFITDKQQWDVPYERRHIIQYIINSLKLRQNPFFFITEQQIQSSVKKSIRMIARQDTGQKHQGHDKAKNQQAVIEYKNDSIHDVLVLILFRAEEQLKFEIFRILGYLGLALPIFFSKPALDYEQDPLLFNIVPLSSVQLSWRDNQDIRRTTNLLFDTSIPLITNVRIGDLGCNKSSFLNMLCQNSGTYQMFQSRQAKGGTTNSHFRRGLGELGWTFFESGKGHQPYLCLNIHGNVLEAPYPSSSRLQRLIFQVSNVIVIFVARDPQNKFLDDIHLFIREYVNKTANVQNKPQLLFWIRDQMLILTEEDREFILEQVQSRQSNLQGVNPFMLLSDRDDEDALADNIMPFFKNSIEDLLYIIQVQQPNRVRNTFQKVCTANELADQQRPKVIKKQVIQGEQNGGFMKKCCPVQRYWPLYAEQCKKAINPGRMDYAQLQQQLIKAEQDKRVIRQDQFNQISKVDAAIHEFQLIQASNNTKSRFMSNVFLQQYLAGINQKVFNKGIKNYNFVQVDLVWRELSQVYEAALSQGSLKPFAHYPRLAAQHLLDGFPLELLDGDSMQVQYDWLQAVFSELISIINGQKLPSNVLVISIIGVQSSGKSTLLNHLFGLQLATSAGKCTKGIFMQLVPVKQTAINSNQFDWVLVVDTEGLRAPDQNYGEDEVVRRDNLLGAFAVGCADICILNSLGEVNEDIKNILMIGVRAIIQKRRINLRNHAIFVHQQVQINNREALESIRSSLIQSLDKYSQQIGEQIQQPINNFQEVVEFNIDKDIVFLPSCWYGEFPRQIPSSQYTKKIQDMQQHIYHISKELGQYRSLREFKEDITSLWSALLSEDFITRFRELSELVKYQRLNESLNGVLEQYRKEQHQLFISYSSKMSNTEQLDKREAQREAYYEVLQDIYRKFKYNLGDAFTRTVGGKGQQDWELMQQRALVQLDNLHQTSITQLHTEFQLVNKMQDVNKNFLKLKQELEQFIDNQIKNKKLKDKKDAIDLLRNRFEDLALQVKQHSSVDVEKKCLNYYLQNLEGYIRVQFVNHIKRNQDLENLGFILNSDEVYQELLLKSISSSKLANRGDGSKPANGEGGQAESQYTIYFSQKIQHPDSMTFSEWTGDQITVLVQNLAYNLEKRVDELLYEASYYNDYYVSDAMKMTMDILHQFSKELQPLDLDITEQFVSRTHFYTYQLMFRRMSVLQKDWERAHLPQLRLDAMFENLENYVMHHVEETQPYFAAAKDLASSLCRSINSHYEYFLVTKMSQIFKQQAFGTSQNAMRMETKIQTIKYMKESRGQDVVKMFTQPIQSYREVMERRLYELQQTKLGEIKQQTIETDLQIQKKLVKAHVYEHLLHVESSFSWSRNVLPQLKRRLKRKLRRYYPRLLESSIDRYIVGKKELQAFWAVFERYVDQFDKWQVDDDVVFKRTSDELFKVLAPCLDRCPFCDAPCCDYRGHLGDHKCFHYPNGLARGQFSDVSKVMYHSCVDRFQQNQTFKNYYTFWDPMRFQDYRKVFPSWYIDGNPSSNDVLAQYAFAKFQKDIVYYWDQAFKGRSENQYRIKECDNIPPEWFNIDVDDLLNIYQIEQS